MATGDSNDIIARVKRLIPSRWFSWVAPYRDAIIGGPADIAAKLYSLIGYARLQTRLSTITGPWLDVFCYDYLRRFLLRQGLNDAAFRAVTQATILQERVTRKGMNSALLTLIKVPPYIFEPWSTNDAGAYSFGAPKYANMAYGLAGGWGSLLYPGQIFLRLSRIGVGASGVPNAQGYYTGQGTRAIGGYGAGAIQYVSAATAQQGITDNVIYQQITRTKPTGVTVWTQFGAGITISQAPAIPSGGVGPTIPLVPQETQPHFIGKFRPVTRYAIFLDGVVEGQPQPDFFSKGAEGFKPSDWVNPHFVGRFQPTSYTRTARFN